MNSAPASIFAAPTDREAASLIVDSILAHPTRNVEMVRASIPAWPAEACHYLADALKTCRVYDDRNILGDSLRSLANLAVMREHKLRLQQAR